MAYLYNIAGSSYQCEGMTRGVDSRRTVSQSPLNEDLTNPVESVQSRTFDTLARWSASRRAALLFTSPTGAHATSTAGPLFTVPAGSPLLPHRE